MQAVRLHSYNFPEAISVDEIEEPNIGEGLVLIEVHASSINPFDVKVSKGAMGDKVSFPITLGGDVAGLVIEVGTGATDFKAGDMVYGQAIVFSKGSGAMAQFATAQSTKIAKVPHSITILEAGALPLVGVSAVQVLTEHISLQSGQKILIHGGGGGIGSTAIQIAKALGAYVITTCSTKDVEFVKSLGADEVIDYTKQTFETLVKDVDCVYDTVGGETLEKSVEVVKSGGIIVSMLGTPQEEKTKAKNIMAIGQSTSITTERLNKLTEFVDSGKVKIQIDKVFPLSLAKDAFIYQSTQHPKGKVVLQIK